MSIRAGMRVLVIAATAGASAAYAHAHLDRATPAAGATLTAAPTEVTLHFTQKLEPKFSTVVVRDAAGKQVDKGDSRVTEGDLAVRQSIMPAMPHIALSRTVVVISPRHALDVIPHLADWFDY